MTYLSMSANFFSQWQWLQLPCCPLKLPSSESDDIEDNDNGDNRKSHDRDDNDDNRDDNNDNRDDSDDSYLPPHVSSLLQTPPHLFPNKLVASQGLQNPEHGQLGE